MVPKISVIVPTYNGRKTLEQTLSSLAGQTLRAFEIIVVDNASTDESTALLQKLQTSRLKFKIISNKKNLGVTGGRNSGINAANKRAKYVFFFDHDMVADKKMLEELVKVAESDSNIGIVTPKIYYWEDKKIIWAAGTDINLWTGQVLFRGGKDQGQFETVEEVQVAPAAILVKRQVIEKIHKFDDRFFATYEDTDFCYRARKVGFKTYYAPLANAYHKISREKKLEQKRLLSRSFWIARNRLIFMREFGKNYLIFLLISPIYFFYFVKLAINQKDFIGLVNYLKGYLAGIMEAFDRK